MKTCYSCKIQKNENDFYIDRRTNGLHGRCIDCIKKCNKNNYNKNKEKWKKRIEDRKINKTYLKKKSKICPQCKKILNINEYYSHIGSADGKSTYCKSCSKQKSIESNYYKSGIKNLKNAISRFENKMKLIVKLGGKCVKCGDSNILHLQIEHKNNDGNKQRKELKTTSFTPKQLKEILENGSEYELQIMCANCNLEKKILNDKYSSKLYQEWIKNSQ